MNKKCKNKKCEKQLPVGYKHKTCESCRNRKIGGLKEKSKGALGVVVLVGGIALSIATKGKIDFKD